MSENGNIEKVDQKISETQEAQPKQKNQNVKQNKTINILSMDSMGCYLLVIIFFIGTVWLGSQGFAPAIFFLNACFFGLAALIALSLIICVIIMAIVLYIMWSEI